MHEGAVVRVYGGTKDRRPGVVLRVFQREGLVMVFVPWGTGTPRDDEPQVVVRPNTAAGTALGIYKPTHFRKGNVTIVSATPRPNPGIHTPWQVRGRAAGRVRVEPIPV
jgi:hypothetical protein